MQRKIPYPETEENSMKERLPLSVTHPELAEEWQWKDMHYLI